MRMIAKLACLSLLFALAGSPAGLAGQTRPFARVEGGMINPEDLFDVVPAFGAALGVGTRSGALLARIVRQDWDRDFGSGLSHARTFVLAEWERAIGDHEQPQPFFRLGAGAMFHPPLSGTWALEAAVGLRYRIIPGVSIVGTAGDLVPRLPSAPTVRCYDIPPIPDCVPTTQPAALQHNLSFLVAVEVRP